ncbi:MAG: 6-phosphofructokinase [Bacteroidales bacterium]|jgi:6-phosphofructokinase 1|nr:6-phosphofructokinase [Bacteroidales bacterium]
MKDSIVILTGGGPAPGINTVVGTIAKTFLSKGYRVIGLHGGYSAIFSKEPRYTDMDFFLADSIFNRGGSYLMMSRYKPTQEDFEKNFNETFFKENNIKLLVTVGGDDTASTANRIAKFLKSKNYPIQNIHVPKTIDNDLPLPNNQPTFGYNSAKSEGTRVATTVYEDARTSGTWYLISAMGRSAGHLALGIAASCHYPMVVIPEMFNKTDVSIEKIVKLAISSIVKRQLMGVTYGGVMISEGVFHILSDEDLKNSGVTFSFDAHGHPELGKVSKAQVFNTVLENKMKELGIKVKTRPVEIGYDVRCQTPVAFDLTYCSQLAYGVWKLFHAGETGCMVYVDGRGIATPLYLTDLQDPETGKIPPRLVDITSEEVQNVFKYETHYIKPEDYEAAKKYLANPEEYDFYKILNWEYPQD